LYMFMLYCSYCFLLGIICSDVDSKINSSCDVSCNITLAVLILSLNIE